MALTFLTSIPAALILYDSILNDTDYIFAAGDDTRVKLGALLEIFLMIGNVGTAVVMFPILRRYSETLSLSYVASRTIKATIIGSARSACSPSSPWATTWPRPSARTEPRSTSRGGPWSRSTTGRSCSGRDLFGVNGILLGWLMYRTGLMPPRLAMLGVIGGPLIFVSAIAVLFGAYEQDGLHALFSVPEFLFEAAFAIYLIVKGSGPRRSSTTLGIPEGTAAPCALRPRG